MQSRSCVRFFLLSMLAFCFPSAAGLAQASSTAAGAYDPRLTFAPLTLPQPVNAYRSSNGAPGPSYWQNEADYELHATLDPTAKQLSTDETISYTNNSPDVLPSLWVQLEQNIYREESRGAVVMGGTMRRRKGEQAGPTPSTDGDVLDAVEIEMGKQDHEGRVSGHGYANADSVGDTVGSSWRPVEGSHQVSLPDHRRMGRQDLVGRNQERRDLRHGAVVSADVRV